MGKSTVQVDRPMASTERAVPIPDISNWSNGFRGWSILNKISDPNSVSPKLGILIATSEIAENRIFGWAALFLLLGAGFGAMAIFQILSPLVMAGFALLFLAAAIYRLASWYLSRDLKVEVFREGFTLTKTGKTDVVYWREIDHVVEGWQKAIYQGIIHVNTHKVEVYKTNGQKIEMDRSLEKIEQIGRFIQLAVADALLPVCIQQLENSNDCDFGAFKINRFGIKHKDKFLPWHEVKSLDVTNMGQTTLRIQKMDSSNWGGGWASENGKSMKNLQLFLNLAYWFIDAAHRPVQDLANSPAQAMDNGDAYLQLEITKAEARDGSQKTFYVGTSMQERELVLRIPAGVQSGTVYRFPSYGRQTINGSTGTLNVEVLVEQVTAMQKRMQEFQILAGIIILAGGLMWLGFWSTLDLVSSLILSIVIGGVGGVLIAIQHRFIGAISGAVGAAVSFILQIVYYEFMYIAFGRESFWNYEAVLVLFLSALPGFGLYALLKKLAGKSPT